MVAHGMPSGSTLTLVLAIPNNDLLNKTFNKTFNPYHREDTRSVAWYPQGMDEIDRIDDPANGRASATSDMDHVGRPSATSLFAPSSIASLPCARGLASEPEGALLDRIRAGSLHTLAVVLDPSTPLSMKDRGTFLGHGLKVSGLLVDRSESTLTVVVRGFGRPPPRLGGEAPDTAAVYVQSRESTLNAPIAPLPGQDGATGGEAAG